MKANNPNEAPEGKVAATPPTQRQFKTVGTGILIIGVAILAYGATAFWLINTLPPNGGAHGRLPSLYVMGAGIVVAILGLVARDFTVARNDNRSKDDSRKGIPTSYGVLGLLAIVIIFFFVVSRL